MREQEALGKSASAQLLRYASKVEQADGKKLFPENTYKESYAKMLIAEYGGDAGALAGLKIMDSPAVLPLTRRLRETFSGDWFTKRLKEKATERAQKDYGLKDLDILEKDPDFKRVFDEKVNAYIEVEVEDQVRLAIMYIFGSYGANMLVQVAQEIASGTEVTPLTDMLIGKTITVTALNLTIDNLKARYPETFGKASVSVGRLMGQGVQRLGDALNLPFLPNSQTRVERRLEERVNEMVEQGIISEDEKEATRGTLKAQLEHGVSHYGSNGMGSQVERDITRRRLAEQYMVQVAELEPHDEGAQHPKVISINQVIQALFEKAQALAETSQTDARTAFLDYFVTDPDERKEIERRMPKALGEEGPRKAVSDEGFQKAMLNYALTELAGSPKSMGEFTRHVTAIQVRGQTRFKGQKDPMDFSAEAWLTNYNNAHAQHPVCFANTMLTETQQGYKKPVSQLVEAGNLSRALDYLLEYYEVDDAIDRLRYEHERGTLKNLANSLFTPDRGEKALGGLAGLAYDIEGNFLLERGSAYAKQFQALLQAYENERPASVTNNPSDRPPLPLQKAHDFFSNQQLDALREAYAKDKAGAQADVEEVFATPRITGIGKIQGYGAEESAAKNFMDFHVQEQVYQANARNAGSTAILILIADYAGAWVNKIAQRFVGSIRTDSWLNKYDKLSAELETPTADGKDKFTRLQELQQKRESGTIETKWWNPLPWVTSELKELVLLERKFDELFKVTRKLAKRYEYLQEQQDSPKGILHGKLTFNRAGQLRELEDLFEKDPVLAQAYRESKGQGERVPTPQELEAKVRRVEQALAQDAAATPDTGAVQPGQGIPGHAREESMQTERQGGVYQSATQTQESLSREPGTAPLPS